MLLIPSPLREDAGAGTLETLRKRATLSLLPLAALLCVVVWGFLQGVGGPPQLARYALLPLALWLLILRVALLRGWLRVQAVWLGGLSAASTLALGELADQGFQSRYLPGLGPASLWFSLPYLVAFSILPPRAAYAFTAAYLTVGATIMLSSTVVLSSSGDLETVTLNARIQFFLFNGMAVTLLWLLTRLRSSLEESSRRAQIDPLTGLPNRRALEPNLEQEMIRAGRYGTPLALLLIDVDHFKTLNDQHGQSAGDVVLREVALRLQGTLRRTDGLTRWTGEEFLVLAPETDLEQAGLLAERLLEAVRRAPCSGHAVTVSVGLSSYQTGDSLEELLARAESALYRAKNRGRNRAEVVATRPRLNTAF